MPNQAVLVEKREGGWMCAVMTAPLAGKPTFGHYQLVDIPTIGAAVAAYRAIAPVSEDALVGVVGCVNELPRDWTGLSVDAAMALGAGWDGAGQVQPAKVFRFGQSIDVGGSERSAELAFAPSFPDAARIYDQLQAAKGFVSRHHVASFDGVVAVYEAFASCGGGPAAAMTAQDVIDHALRKTDENCMVAIDYVADAISTISGDIALEQAATGSIMIGGPLIEQISPLMDKARAERLFRAKGPAAHRLRDVTLTLSDPAASGFRGLAAKMLSDLCAEQKSGPASDVDALDLAWDEVGAGPAWALDRSLRLVHVKNIGWSDHLSADVPATPGTPFGALIHAMAGEGLLAEDTDATALLRQLSDGDVDVRFTRYGEGGDLIQCDGRVVPNGGIIFSESRTSQIAMPSVDEGVAELQATEIATMDPEVLDLTSAEEILDAAVAQSPEVSQGQSLSVLIVDCHTVSRMILKTVVTHDGYEALTACDGKAALEAFSQSEPDIVLLNTELGEVDGCEIARHIRVMETASQSRTRSLLVGLMPSENRHRRVEALAAGMDECLPKPLNHSAFRDLIGKWRGVTLPKDLSARALGVGG